MSNIASKGWENIAILIEPEGQSWPTCLGGPQRWQEILKEFFQNGRGGRLRWLQRLKDSTARVEVRLF